MKNEIKQNFKKGQKFYIVHKEKVEEVFFIETKEIEPQNKFLISWGMTTREVFYREDPAGLKTEMIIQETELFNDYASAKTKVDLLALGKRLSEESNKSNKAVEALCGITTTPSQIRLDNAITGKVQSFESSLPHNREEMELKAIRKVGKAVIIISLGIIIGIIAFGLFVL